MKEKAKKELPYFDMTNRKLMNVQKAWKEGKNPKLTVLNPDPSDSSQVYVRIPANDVWGKPRSAPVLKFSGGSE